MISKGFATPPSPSSLWKKHTFAWVVYFPTASLFLWNEWRFHFLFPFMVELHITRVCLIGFLLSFYLFFRFTFVYPLRPRRIWSLAWTWILQMVQTCWPLNMLDITLTQVLHVKEELVNFTVPMRKRNGKRYYDLFKITFNVWSHQVGRSTSSFPLILFFKKNNTCTQELY